jgi:type IV pilus assembly protein PilM
MASKFDSVWAIDVGNNALKAIRLATNDNGEVEVIGFDNIQHGKILTGFGVKGNERAELIAISLRKFAEQNEVGKDGIVISVPSQNSFARFVNLPPVEAKRVPELVKFEASQQIPFDINEVQWDWQVMSEPDATEKRVGIFAIKNDVVDSLLENFDAENMSVTCVQMAPMALYNYILYDHPELEDSDNKAIVLIDIGAENTDLVVCSGSTVWQRCIPMGGNAFTRAIAEAFKLSFQKAEKLKRTAPMSKYARQIFQAMRPVFTDLASEIQRSLNFYGSSNSNVKLVKAIAFGGGTKMRGLLKYLRQTLQIPVERPDAFKRLAIGADVSAAKLHENVADLGIVYGLGVQGLGICHIESNLLPSSIARSMAWASKAKYFWAAACMLLVVSIMCFARTNVDRLRYKANEPDRRDVKRVINNARRSSSNLQEQETLGSEAATRIQKEFKPFAYRNVVPLLYQTILSELPNANNNPSQADLYKAFTEGNVEGIKSVPRKERKQIFVTNMSVTFTEDVNNTSLGKKNIRTSRAAKKKADAAAADAAFERDRMEAEYAALGMDVPEWMPSEWDEPGAVAGTASEPGFIVTLVGYSPYNNLKELLDPPRVGDDPDRWGFVTRLTHLADSNGPFKLFSKKSKHFKLQEGDVGMDDASETPNGIGVQEFWSEIYPKNNFLGENDTVLLDPMTKEIISRLPKANDQGIAISAKNEDDYDVNDRWFILRFKIAWLDSSADTSASGSGSTY